MSMVSFPFYFSDEETEVKDLGLWLDTSLFEQQNTKKLHGTKNNCVHAPWGPIPDPNDTKRPKTPTATLFRSLEQKQGVGRKNMPPAHTPPTEWANHLSHPSSLTPGHTSTLTLYKEQAREVSKQGNL